MQYSARLLFVVCVCILLTTSCSNNSKDNPIDPGNNKSTVLTTIAGVISDEHGNLFSGVSVTAHGKTAVTNQYGFFVFKDVRVPQDRCFILARQDGYFTTSRAEVPKANGVTNMRLSMMRNGIDYNVSASAGGTVNIVIGGIADFPANSFMTESGAPYTGTVTLMGRWLDPSWQDYDDFFSGDFTATRTDGSETLLYSYGILDVELYPNEETKVKLADSKRVTMKYPIPSSMLSGAPGEMPLWYFDEGIGMWKEEGKAVKQGDFYVGEVSRLTSWNCAVPIPMAIVKGHVYGDSNSFVEVSQEKIVPWARIQVGHRQVIADENGYYEVRVPAGLEFKISVDASRNMGSKTVILITVGPLSEQQTFTQDIIITPRPTYISGMLTDCEGNPTEGVVQITSEEEYAYSFIARGRFRVCVKPDVQLAVNAIDYNGAAADPIPIKPIVSGTINSIGNMPLCQKTTTGYIDITLASDREYKNIVLSPDGSMVAVNRIPDVAVQIYDTRNGTLLQELEFPKRNSNPITIEFSRDSRKLMCSRNGSYLYDIQGYQTVIWNTSTWQEIGSFTGLERPRFMSDGNSLLSTEYSTQQIVQSSIPSGTEMKRFTVTGGADIVVGVRPNGTEVVYREVLSSDASRVNYNIWNLVTNTLVRTISTEKTPSLSVSGLNEYLDDNYLGIITQIEGSGRVLYFYDMSDGRQTDKVTLNPNGAVTVRPASKQFLYARSGLPLALYNISDGSLVRLLPSSLDRSGRASFCADGSKMAGLWYYENKSYLRIWSIP